MFNPLFDAFEMGILLNDDFFALEIDF